MHSLFLKRCFDLVAVILSFPIWFPVLVVIACLVRLNLGAPVFFRQRRPGRGERIFELVKFRTMRGAADAHGNPLPDVERLTKFGRWLRATSLDELPELFNILKGDMSLVGPRPLFVAYLPRYSERQRHLHEAPPGLTGLAQIKGRNALSWEAKFEWDVSYVESRTITLDVKILWLTIWKVFQRDGIAAEGEATMSEFNQGQSPCTST